MGFARETIEQLTGVKNWIHYTSDPKAGELANSIDDFFGTGTVKKVAENFEEKAGYAAGDFDIVLNKINIGVKTGGGKGGTSQAVKEMGQSLLNDKKYIFVSIDKNFKGSVETGLKAKGIEVFRLIKKDGTMDMSEIFRLTNYIQKHNK